MTPITLRRPIMWQEVILSCVLAILGILWIIPGDAFEAGPSYHIMSSMASETVWGAGFILAATFGIVSALKGPLLFRRLSSTTEASLLLFVGLSFFFSNPATIFGWVVMLWGLAAIMTRLDLR